MTMFNIYTEYLTKRYHTHLWSFSTIFFLLVGIITYIGPLLIAFFSLGFWLKESTYREQPEVRYKHELVLIVQGLSSLSAYSTFANLNSLFGNRMRIPTIKSIEVDENRDGKYDYLELDFEIPVGQTEQVNTVQLLLFFDYKLHQFTTVQMESIAYIHFESSVSGSAFHTDGDLIFKQKYPLLHKGYLTKFNTPIIPKTSTNVDELNIQSILRKYQYRNLTTDFIGRYPVWIPGSAAGSTFRMAARIYYPEQTIIYRPGFWQLLKHAWVQYLAILFIFLFLFGHVKKFIYENQLVNTVVKKAHLD